MIPEAAVEAAAEAALRVMRVPNEVSRLDVARAALEAAAPHMLAEAWQDGATDGHLYGIKATNPYRTAKSKSLTYEEAQAAVTIWKSGAHMK